MKQKNFRTINGIRLKLTCSACPEQYDAYYDGDQIGYLRLRHGTFTVEYKDVGGVEVLNCDPAGDGMFDDDERETYLTLAVDQLRKAHGLRPIDPAPVMEDTREYLDTICRFEK